MPLKPKFGDFFIVLIIVALAFSNLTLFQSHASGEAEAVITQNGTVIKRLELNSLTKPQSFIINGEYKLVISIEKNKIRFSEANCPDKTCVHTGWISNPGQIAVCIPSKVMIKIEGKSNNDVDIVLN